MSWDNWIMNRSGNERERCEHIAKHIIDRDDLKKKDRHRRVIYKRMVLYYILYIQMNAGFSTTQVGRLFDRDHATVLNGLKQFKDLQNYADVRKIYNRYIKEFES